jgi:polyisoprenoid-binding protein YceI
MTIERWNIDTAHSNVEFTARHLVVTKVRGHFGKWSGHIDIDPTDVTKSSAAATFEVDSIDTREAQRDGHLKSPDFLDAASHPTITFTSKKVEKDGSDLKVTGDLTIRGTTKEVTLAVESHGTNKDPWGNTKALFAAKAHINRKDFGVNFNAVLEAGGVLVSEKIEIEIEIQAAKAAPAA